MKPIVPKRAQDGITLIEMMVVMVVLAIVVIGAFSGFDLLRSFIQADANKLEALGHAQALLEELRSMPGDSLSYTPLDGTEVSLPADSHLRTVRNAVRRYYITDYEHPAGTVIGKKIDVILDWDE